MRWPSQPSAANPRRCACCRVACSSAASFIVSELPVFPVRAGSSTNTALEAFSIGIQRSGAFSAPVHTLLGRWQVRHWQPPCASLRRSSSKYCDDSHRGPASLPASRYFTDRASRVLALVLLMPGAAQLLNPTLRGSAAVPAWFSFTVFSSSFA